MEWALVHPIGGPEKLISDLERITALMAQMNRWQAVRLIQQLVNMQVQWLLPLALHLKDGAMISPQYHELTLPDWLIHANLRYLAANNPCPSDTIKEFNFYPIKKIWTNPALQIWISESLGEMSDSQREKIIKLTSAFLKQIGNILTSSQLAKSAYSDPLTWLFNRRALFDGFEGFLATLDEQDALVVSIKDLDDFKSINGTGDLETWDKALKIVWELLGDAYRLWWEEFMQLYKTKLPTKTIMVQQRRLDITIRSGINKRIKIWEFNPKSATFAKKKRAAIMTARWVSVARWKEIEAIYEKFIKAWSVSTWVLVVTWVYKAMQEYMLDPHINPQSRAELLKAKLSSMLTVCARVAKEAKDAWKDRVHHLHVSFDKLEVIPRWI